MIEKQDMPGETLALFSTLNKAAHFAMRILRGVRVRLRRLLVSRKAKLLNKELYADYHAVSPQQWSEFTDEIRQFCQARQYSPEYTEGWVSHRYRLYFTLEWIRKITEEYPGLTIGLEVGGASIMTDLICQYFPQLQWQNTNGDLRFPWDIKDQSVDLIVCTEVLEHLSDIPEGYGDSFFKTGLRAALREAYRVLRPGGVMLITTPNAASVLHLESVLYGGAPWFYQLHVREYTPDEILLELQQAGFTIQRWRTVHCLTIDHQKNYSILFHLLLKYHYTVLNRGDDLFLIAQKN